MAHPARECVDVYAGRDRERRIGVVYIVEPNIRQGSFLRRRIKLVSEIALIGHALTEHGARQIAARQERS